MSISRLGTANMYDRTINNINRQQNELASQMEHTSAGMRVIRPSDDPVAAAQAERARNRLERIASDQRGLDAQKATIEYAESTLGEINDALQEFRSLLVQAGNGAYNQVQRDTLVEQLTSLRSTPNLDTWRPADAVESAVAWKYAIERADGPSALIFSRQNLPHQARDAQQLADVAAKLAEEYWADHRRDASSDPRSLTRYLKFSLLRRGHTKHVKCFGLRLACAWFSLLHRGLRAGCRRKPGRDQPGETAGAFPNIAPDSDGYLWIKQDKFHESFCQDLSDADALVMAVTQKAPLASTFGDNVTALMDLAAGRLDFAVDAPLNTDPQVRHVKLMEDRYVCAMRPGHPLAKDKLSLDEYLSLAYIQISSRRSGLGYIDLSLGKMGLQRKVALRSQHYLMASSVLHNTDMLMTVPERFARRHNLHHVDLPVSDVPALETHLYWHESTDQDPANRWMREQMIELAQQITAQERAEQGA